MLVILNKCTICSLFTKVPSFVSNLFYKRKLEIQRFKCSGETGGLEKIFYYTICAYL